jgi:hypothetical protein
LVVELCDRNAYRKSRHAEAAAATCRKARATPVHESCKRPLIFGLHSHRHIPLLSSLFLD